LSFFVRSANEHSSSNLNWAGEISVLFFEIEFEPVPVTNEKTIFQTCHSFEFTLSGRLTFIMNFPPSPPQTSRTAGDLVDLTLGNWDYFEEFPSIQTTFKSSNCLPRIKTPTKPISPSELSPSLTGSLACAIVAHELLTDSDSDSSASTSQARSCKPSAPKKPRLEWKIEQAFQSSQEQSACAGASRFLVLGTTRFLVDQEPTVHWERICCSVLLLQWKSKIPL
jgi:hypothetical protein